MTQHTLGGCIVGAAVKLGKRSKWLAGTQSLVLAKGRAVVQFQVLVPASTIGGPPDNSAPVSAPTYGNKGLRICEMEKFKGRVGSFVVTKGLPYEFVLC